ncbi:hypothetical protein [Marinifilum caeruleilacunae]|uniref:Uncharacterized protein n=1 Tax=Marinifilum caeruleilacunae TaxID=2499076 RepID=A0ABX1X1M6_9BACT|nr:hypothetical protein [Marinifilum caeruleilacunae]NOU61988.1 hypothetical protein [Marinifilum caeruleilacunae]
MTTLLIILGAIGALTGVFLISNRIGLKRIMQEKNEVLNAHKKLGYPKLEKSVQFKIMETGDISPIAQLIPELSEKSTPLILLRHYITISKNEFKEYLLKSDFVNKHKVENAPNPKHDGMWIRENEIIDQERGYVHRTWQISSDKEAIDIYSDLLWEKINFE